MKENLLYRWNYNEFRYITSNPNEMEFSYSYTSRAQMELEW